MLTGDRPARLQGLGAPQTCDQLNAYGSHVRAFRNMPEPAADASAKKDVDGLKVLVLCAGAGTSAMLANAIKEGAAQTGENIASSAGAYGQHTAIMDQYDVIVLAPQVRSYYNDMKADTDRLGIKLLAPRGKEYIDLTRDPAGAIKWLRENLD